MRALFSALSLLLCMSFSATAAELYGTLKKVQDSGAIVLGHREASYPLSFIDEAKNPAGYSVDLCLRVVAAVKQELQRDDLTVRFVPVTSKSRIPLLQDGTIDIECGSTTNTLTRQAQVDFSFITFISGAKLLIRKDSKIKDFGGLAGKEAAIAPGTTTYEGIKGVLERTALEVEIVEVSDHDEGFRALAEGRVAAYISDHVLLLGLKDRAEEPDNYSIVGKVLSYEPYGLMLRRDDSAFRLVVNRTLTELFRSDEISKIYVKWFGPLGLSPSEFLRAAVQVQTFPK